MHPGRAAAIDGARAVAETLARRRVVGTRSSQFDQAWAAAEAVPGWFRPVNAAAMFAVFDALRPSAVVEIGSYLGQSTAFLATTLRQLGIPGRVTAIDPHTGDRQHLEKLGAASLPSYDLFSLHMKAVGVGDMVDAIVAPSAVAAEGWTSPIDFLYVDGWHSYDAVYADGLAYLPHLSPRGVVFFDDYIRYPELNDAVRTLDREGRFNLWGSFFGQAFGGRAAKAPDELQQLVKLGRSPLNYFHRQSLARG